MFRSDPVSRGSPWSPFVAKQAQGIPVMVEFPTIYITVQRCNCRLCTHYDVNHARKPPLSGHDRERHASGVIWAGSRFSANECPNLIRRSCLVKFPELHKRIARCENAIEPSVANRVLDAAQKGCRPRLVAKLLSKDSLTEIKAA
jgi:hypothetical protein